MTNKEFKDFLSQCLLKTEDVLSLKANEYAVDENRFHNFDIAVDILKHVGVIDTPAKVAFAFRVKHLVSIIDLLNEDKPNISLINEKCGDDINYGFLMQALLTREAK